MRAAGRMFGRGPVPEDPSPAYVSEILYVCPEAVRGPHPGRTDTWAAARLNGAGIEVGRVTVLPSELSVVCREVAAAMVRGPALIVVLGGVGPTDRDITFEAVALACGLPLAADDDAARMAGESGTREQADRMVRLPRGATPLPNPAGSAPGAIVDLRHRLILCLPSSPEQLPAMWDATVSEILQIRMQAGA